MHCLKTSTTLYVGNLSFYTTEEQIYEASRGCRAAVTVSCGWRAVVGRKPTCGSLLTGVLARR